MRKRSNEDESTAAAHHHAITLEKGVILRKRAVNGPVFICCLESHREIAARLVPRARRRHKRDRPTRVVSPGPSFERASTTAPAASSTNSSRRLSSIRRGSAILPWNAAGAADEASLAPHDLAPALLALESGRIVRSAGGAAARKRRLAECMAGGGCRGSCADEG